MAELPVGTVTFLLTDVEGSTALWEQASEAMRTALARHDALFEHAVCEHGGVHIRPRGEGDSRFAVFAGASEALAAALAVQRAFADEAWTTPRPISVRIGIHTGEAEARDGDYYGAAVNRCARLRGIGHGGQVLLSESTTALVRDDLPAAASLLDLGEHRLRDLSRPERVHQLVAPGLAVGFPPLASLDARPHNLPLQTTPLLGRDQDIRAVRGLLLRDNVRLVTLTGPGGTGKTRLSLEVASDSLDQFEDGACFVELVTVSDPERVPSAIAQAIGVREVVGRPLLDVLVDYLRGRQLLLVLDNFEQVVAAAPLVDTLLRACSRLRVLVTSRSALQLRGEHEYPVPLLALPDSGRSMTPEALSQYGAVALFIDRATAIKPDFVVTNANAPAVAEICARLDGLPLAIELAAARIRLLPPEAMLPRLGHGLTLLSGGRRDLPARQRTLRDAIAWSYDLLPDAEQRLFRHLSVFVGGFTLAAAERVRGVRSEVDGAAAPPADVLDGVGSLVGHSLVRADELPGGEPRFRMLGTIREYALEQLARSGELETIQHRHATCYLELAVEAEGRILGRDQVHWLDRLDRDHDNLLAALAWAIEGSNVDLAMQMGVSLAYFWYYRSYYSEAQALRASVLALPAGPDLDALRATLLQGAGLLARRVGDLDASRAFLDEGLTIARRVGDRGVLIPTLATLGLTACTQGDYATARAAAQEGVKLALAAGDTYHAAMAKHVLGLVALDADGDLETAWSSNEESLTLYRQIGNQRMTGVVRAALGRVARARGDLEGARALVAESLRLHVQVGDVGMVSTRLYTLAEIDADARRFQRTVTLAGAASAVDEAMGIRAAPRSRRDRDACLARARAALPHEIFARAWTEGQSMTRERAIAYALEGPERAETDGLVS
jgi:predicted ATPase/class 3 adenylate cyclase